MSATDDPERYEELMDMPPTELVDEYLSLEKQVKRLRKWKEAFEYYMGKAEAKQYVVDYMKEIIE